MSLSAKAFVVEQVDKLRSGPSTIEVMPEYLQISGSVKKDGIYRFLRREQPELLNRLPGANRRRRIGKKVRTPLKRRIPKVSIEQRPPALAGELGYLQADTMHGKQGSEVLAVFIDQESCKICLKRMKSTDSKSFLRACTQSLSKFEIVRNVLLDNGPETYCYPEIERDLGTEVYFCHPLAPWEKGGVENRIARARAFVRSCYVTCLHANSVR